MQSLEPRSLTIELLHDSQVYDQHLDYLVLAPSLFSLAPSVSTATTSAAPSTSSNALQPSATAASDVRTTYERLNEARASEEDIEDITDRVAKGLFSVLVTMGASASLTELAATRLSGSRAIDDHWRD